MLPTRRWTLSGGFRTVPLAWYPCFPRSGGSLRDTELQFLGQAAPSISGGALAPAPSLQAKPPPPPEKETALHLPSAHCEPRGSILTGVHLTRCRGPPGTLGHEALGFGNRSKISRCDGVGSRTRRTAHRCAADSCFPFPRTGESRQAT